MAKSGQERVVSINGVDVYAPLCPTCGKDDGSWWVRMPIHEGCGTAACGCTCRPGERIGPGQVSKEDESLVWFDASPSEVSRCLEPVRLASRLAALMGGKR